MTCMSLTGIASDGGLNRLVALPSTPDMVPVIGRIFFTNGVSISLASILLLNSLKPPAYASPMCHFGFPRSAPSMPRTEVPQVLSEFARALAPQGHLLVDFFRGESSEPFDHAVTRAYYWSVNQMSNALQAAGFHVIDVETRLDPGSQPHAAIYATLA